MSIAIPANKIPASGEALYSLCKRMFPICRSITGNGVRDTLAIIKEHIDLNIIEVPSGTPVFDWVVPKEWNIRDAWIKDSNGNKIVDFKNNNLHVLNYSKPVHGKLDLSGLKEHLYTLPEQPTLIPYRTSYYQENWGFCISHQQYLDLEEDTYEVFIDSSLQAGNLTFGEYYIPGQRKEEILFSTHICHPSLANDNLSGISILTYLAKALSRQKNQFSYRFLFIPGTIGSITWLALNTEKIKHIKGGLVASLLGDSGNFTFKKSRQGNSEIDFVVQQVLKNSGQPFSVLDFVPYGYDERQFCVPAFDLAVGNLTRSQYGQYPEYHTSADNMALISPQQLEGSFRLYYDIVKTLEEGIYYKNLLPNGEPQLGKRGLYEAIGGDSDQKLRQMAMLWILNLADGEHSLQRMANKSGYEYKILKQVGQLLYQKRLLEKL